MPSSPEDIQDAGREISKRESWVLRVVSCVGELDARCPSIRQLDRGCGIM
jgi:hypothetical protein